MLSQNPSFHFSFTFSANCRNFKLNFKQSVLNRFNTTVCYAKFIRKYETAKVAGQNSCYAFKCNLFLKIIYYAKENYKIKFLNFFICQFDNFS